jgi:sugar (pentulose or hexulose) kinase
MGGGKQETFLGLDIGTSSIKALLVDADQRVVAEASTPLSVSRPHPLWSEQDPGDWIEGVEAPRSAAMRRRNSLRSRGSDSRARCTAQLCSTRMTNR